jgi:hypothetical protein
MMTDAEKRWAGEFDALITSLPLGPVKLTKGAGSVIMMDYDEYRSILDLVQLLEERLA